MGSAYEESRTRFNCGPQTFGIAKPSGTQAISGLGDRAYCQISSLVWVLRGSEELGVSAPKALVAEIIGGELARRLGLRTPEIVLRLERGSAG